MNNLILALCCAGLFIGQPDKSPPDYFAEYIKSLQSKDVKERRSAVASLQLLYHKGGEPTKELSEALVKALNDPDAKVRQHTAALFSMFIEVPKPAISVLASLVRDDKKINVRRAAANALFHAGSTAKEVLPILKEAKKDKDGKVRVYAGAAVARIEDTDEEALRFLLQYSTDKDEEVQGEARRVFSDLGVRAIPVLKDGLKDKNPEIRSWTITAIRSTRQKVTEDAKFPLDVIPLLIKAIDDVDNEVVCTAIYTVSDIGPRAKDAIPAIVKRFKDPSWTVRTYAIRHIDQFGPASESAIPALKEALKDEEESVRLTAKRALAAIELAAIERAKKATTP
jgi:HEAT repeat protein